MINNWIGLGIPVSGIAPLWPVDIGIRPVPVRPYAGYFVDRQSRFYLRGLRRGGLFFEDVPAVVLWADNAWDTDDIWSL